MNGLDDPNLADESPFNTGIYRKKGHLNERAFSYSIRQEHRSRSYGSLANLKFATPIPNGVHDVSGRPLIIKRNMWLRKICWVNDNCWYFLSERQNVVNVDIMQSTNCLIMCLLAAVDFIERFELFYKKLFGKNVRITNYNLLHSS